jgi:hypothetical protein
MIDTTFEVCSLDRNLIHWEDHILDLSPVQKVGDMWFKREDFFAPLGYGNINGSKLRVCIWLINEFVKERNTPEHIMLGVGPVGVVQGAVTGSPQHPMVATICKHYGLKSVHLVGSSDIDNHKNLKIARDMGAEFIFSNVGYAKTLEAKSREYAENHKGFFFLETNITVGEHNNSARRIMKFHRVGAAQVANIPDHIETMIIPAGSCNSITSVLYGIAKYRPKSLKKIVIMGIGNYGSKDPDYIRRRLHLISGPDNENLDLFDFPWNKEYSMFTSDEFPYTIEYYDLNGSGYCEYSDLMPFRYNSIDFHPRYEAKIFNYMKDKNLLSKYENDKTLFWIVGSEPQIT